MSSNNLPSESNNIIKLIKFAGVGAIGTLLHYAVLISLVEINQVGVVYATTAGFIVGAIFNYAMSFKYVFHSEKKHSNTLPKFLSIAVITGFLNSTVMWTFAEIASIHYIGAQIIATGVAFTANYLINSKWTFQ